MKKWLFFTFYLCAISTYAQYSKPYRIAYNPENKAYVITNRGNGNIIQLDSAYNTSTVITGLTDPRDLAFGSFAGITGLLVVDNNQIVVYNASNYQKIISYSVTGAQNLEDIEIDPYNLGYFYLSDVGNNRILKGKVGAPPFYTPTYSVLSQNQVHRPKGMVLDRKGRLLVVSDSIGGEIYQIDTSKGGVKLLFTSGLDSLNHISNDKEGNYFLTNWSNSYLYRVDGNFSNLTKLTSYNKPAGMYVNVETDLMLIVCHLCNKLEFQKLHFVEPKQSIESCMRDSFSVDVDIQYNGIGTYLTGNNFIIELSDANGSFAKPSSVGSLQSIQKPSEINGYLPQGKYGTGHKYRIRSSHPSFPSQSFDFKIFSTPSIGDFLSDSVFACKSSKVNVGKMDDTTFNFAWSPGSMLSDSTISSPEFDATSSGAFKYTLKVVNKDGICADSGQTLVDVTPEIKLNPWKRLRTTCVNQPISIGGTQNRYEYLWSPGIQLSDSTSMIPIFKAESSQKYRVSVRDTNSGCTGVDSVQVDVSGTPKISFNQNKVETCINQLVKFGVSSDTGVSFKWLFPVHLVDSVGPEVAFLHDQPGTFKYLLRVTNSAGCKSDTFLNVENVALPTYKDFSVTYPSWDWPNLNIQVNINTDLANTVEMRWDSMPNVFSTLGWLNETLDSVFKVKTESNLHYFYAVITNPLGCVTISDTLIQNLNGAKTLDNKNFKAYPNPIIGTLFIDNSFGDLEAVEIWNTAGKLVFKEEISSPQELIDIDVRTLPAGVYRLSILRPGGVLSQQVIKL